MKKLRGKADPYQPYQYLKMPNIVEDDTVLIYRESTYQAIVGSVAWVNFMKFRDLPFTGSKTAKHIGD